MGIGNSREPHGRRHRRRSRSPGLGIFGGKNNRRGHFRRRSPSPTTELTLPASTLPMYYQPLYGSYYANRQLPLYAPPQPIASPYLPMSYNNYSTPSNIVSQYMMMLQQRGAPPMPIPYTSPPMSIPYAQQPQIQPAYNNIGGAPAPMPPGMPIGTGVYPPSYASAPVRLLTDWTGGGQISPGFLGPPL